MRRTRTALRPREGSASSPTPRWPTGSSPGNTGRTDDLSASTRGPGVGKKYLNDRGLRIVAALEETAREHGTSLVAVAIAWLIARPSITAAIASATSPRQLDDLVTATTLHLDRNADRPSGPGQRLHATEPA